MFAVTAARFDSDDPLNGLEAGERPDPEVPDGWTTVQVKAASLNHHDLFSLQGIGLPEERMPMILGTDAAGLDEDGNEVVVHGVVASPGWTGDETLDPKRTLFSELHQGTMAEKVAVPRRNLDWVRPHTDLSAVDEDEALLLADAQTSGGLLLAGEVPGAPVIGEFVPRQDAIVVVR